MNLETKIELENVDNETMSIKLFKAGSVYTLASVVDTIITALYLQTSQVTEANPIIDYLIQNYGLSKGLILPKIAGLGVILGSCYCLQKGYEQGKTFMNTGLKIRPENVIYPLAILTCLASAHYPIFNSIAEFMK